jgi:hypothetical protein
VGGKYFHQIIEFDSISAFMVCTWYDRHDIYYNHGIYIHLSTQVTHIYRYEEEIRWTLWRLYAHCLQEILTSTLDATADYFLFFDALCIVSVESLYPAEHYIICKRKLNIVYIKLYFVCLSSSLSHILRVVTWNITETMCIEGRYYLIKNSTWSGIFLHCFRGLPTLTKHVTANSF